MSYRSLDDILRDRRLGFATAESSSDAVKRAIEKRLKELVAGSPPVTSDEQRLLIEARTWIHAHLHSETTTVDLPATINSAVLEHPRAALNDRQQPNRLVTGETLLEHCSVNVKKASSDFRSGRVVPVTGLGVVTGVLLASRDAFGVTDTVDSTVWYVACAVALAATLAIGLLARRHQNHDESLLHRLYDPDIHAVLARALLANDYSINPYRLSRSEFLHVAADIPGAFTRTDFADMLWFATSREGMIRRNVWSRFSLSTVDLLGAIEDAATLGLERLVELRVLKRTILSGVECFMAGDAGKES